MCICKFRGHPETMLTSIKCQWIRSLSENGGMNPHTWDGESVIGEGYEAT